MRRFIRDKGMVCVPKAATGKRRLLFKMIVSDNHLNCGVVLCSPVESLQPRLSKTQQQPCDDTAFSAIVFI